MNWRVDFDRLVAEFGPRLLSHCSRELGCNYQDAEDAVQFAFTQLLVKQEEIQASSDRQVFMWLRTTAINFRKTNFRKTNREHVLDGEYEESVTARAGGALHITDDIRRAIEQLPAKQREVLELYHFEEIPYEKIADQLGVAVGTVWYRVHAAEVRLRELLPEYGPDG